MRLCFDKIQAILLRTLFFLFCEVFVSEVLLNFVNCGHCFVKALLRLCTEAL